MKTLLAVLILCLHSCVSPVFAKVDVTPSVREDLFACNVGISHPSVEDDSCTEQGSGTSCSEQEEDLDEPVDKFKVTYEDLTVPEESPLRVRGASKGVMNGSTNYVELFPSTQPWTQKITGLEFKFESELYGARYFVDFCYLGPSPKNNGNGKDQTVGVYEMNAMLSAQELAGASYIGISRLVHKTELKCDLRNEGNQTEGRADSVLSPVGGSIEVDSSYFSDWSQFSSSALSFEARINSHELKVPRFCKVRVYFRESVTTARLHRGIGSEVTVDIDIFK